MKNIEYVILSGAFFSLISIGCIVVMIYTIRMNKMHNEQINKEVRKMTDLINGTNEVKKVLIEQIKKLTETLKNKQ